MNNKKKRLAQRRAASKSIRTDIRDYLHNLVVDPELEDDKYFEIHPWWENKKLGVSQVLERERYL